ncbi:hypothetical protein D9M71_816920 [compost metagenome]
MAWTSSADQPLALLNPSVAVRLPSAIDGNQRCFCWSLAASNSAGVARQAVAKKGEHSRRRPICSSRIASSTKPRPRPP